MLTSRYAATLAGTLANVLESFALPLSSIAKPPLCFRLCLDLSPQGWGTVPVQVIKKDLLYEEHLTRSTMFHAEIASGYVKHSYWKWWFIVELPIENGDVPWFSIVMLVYRMAAWFPSVHLIMMKAWFSLGIPSPPNASCSYAELCFHNKLD